MTKKIFLMLMLFCLVMPAYADRDRRDRDGGRKEFRDGDGRRGDGVGRRGRGGRNGDQARGRRGQGGRGDRDNARRRRRDFFCSRTGRCRPGDPQVDELSTAAMGAISMGFVTLMLYRGRREKLGFTKDDC